MTCGNCACNKLKAYILLDRSGSMSSTWTETLGAVNTYVTKLKEAGTPASVTFAVFDAQDKLDYVVLRDAVDVKDWSNVTDKEASPRGMTPLLDALSKMISSIQSNGGEKAVLLVATDGAENASREAKKEDIKAGLDKLKAKGYEVIFIGADFNNFGQASSLGIDMGKTIQMTRGMHEVTFDSLAAKSALYASGAQVMSFSDTERALYTGNN